MSNATDKQIAFILSLASKVQDDRVRFLSQVKCIKLSQREARGGMTRVEASEHIDELQDLLNA
jgi:hypothetical protein